MTLEQAQTAQEAAYCELIGMSMRVDDGVAEGLADVNGTPVEVLRVASAMLRRVTGANASGCPMRYEGRCAIFLSDSPSYPSPCLSQLSGHWLDRLCVLHEYGHILCGDVFEDDPERFYNLAVDLAKGCPGARDQRDEIELAADRHAFPRLVVEARDAGEEMLAAELQCEIQERGLNR